MTKTERKRKKKRQTRNRKLIEKYPWLLPKNAWTGKPVDNYHYEFTEIDTLPDGWVKGFGKVFIEELGAAIKEAGLENSYYVMQVKEKYGQLRWYDSGGTEKMHRIIDAFSHISENVCISCGKLDVPMLCDGGWYSPYCRSCFKENYRRNERWYKEKEIASDEFLNGLYLDRIADEPDENGNYKIRPSYEVRCVGGETVKYDISDLVNKVRGVK